MKPISIQLYSLREEAKNDFAAVLKSVAEIGYRGVEPAEFYGLKPREFRRRVEDLGMTISSNHGPWPNRDNLNEVVDVASELGVKTAVCGFGAEQFKDRAAIRDTADTVNFMIERLAAAGITLAMHNHYWEFNQVEGRLAYDRLMEACPRLTSELDVYWAANFGACNPAEVVARYRRRTPLLHMKDGPLVKGQPMLAVGSGRMDIPAVVRAADESVLRWLVVELDSCATDMLRAVADSYRYLVGQGLADGNRPA